MNQLSCSAILYLFRHQKEWLCFDSTSIWIPVYVMCDLGLCIPFPVSIDYSMSINEDDFCLLTKIYRWRAIKENNSASQNAAKECTASQTRTGARMKWTVLPLGRMGTNPGPSHPDAGGTDLTLMTRISSMDSPSSVLNLQKIQ